MFVLVTYDINVAAPEGAKRLRRERVCSYSCACSCRSPHGERGLKSCTMNFSAPDSKSLPARGAWIEIVHDELLCARFKVAPRTGSVD